MIEGGKRNNGRRVHVGWTSEVRLNSSRSTVQLVEYHPLLARVRGAASGETFNSGVLSGDQCSTVRASQPGTSPMATTSTGH